MPYEPLVLRQLVVPELHPPTLLLPMLLLLQPTADHLLFVDQLSLPDHPLPGLLHRPPPIYRNNSSCNPLHFGQAWNQIQQLLPSSNNKWDPPTLQIPQLKIYPRGFINCNKTCSIYPLFERANQLYNNPIPIERPHHHQWWRLQIGMPIIPMLFTLRKNIWPSLPREVMPAII